MGHDLFLLTLKLDLLRSLDARTTRTTQTGQLCRFQLLISTTSSIAFSLSLPRPTILFNPNCTPENASEFVPSAEEKSR
jgi:hypothetical protein